jgi:hypothetical protein
MTGVLEALQANPILEEERERGERGLEIYRQEEVDACAKCGLIPLVYPCSIVCVEVAILKLSTKGHNLWIESLPQCVK